MRIQFRKIGLAAALAVAFAASSARAQTSPPAAPSQAQGVPQNQTPPAAPTPSPQIAPAPWPVPRRQASAPARAPVARSTEERSGSFSTHDGQRLHLETVIGSIRILTDATDEVRYIVRIEADAGGGTAKEVTSQFALRAQSLANGITISGNMARRDLLNRVQVFFEIHVPRRYNVEATTQAGNIQVDDLDGRATLITNAGDITAGRIGGNARIESTDGGHILIGNVTGDLRVTTAGGHITAGNVTGSAVLTTGGGHIHAGVIGGTAQVETGGGNVSIQRSGGHVTASSGGGQINFGEAAGPIQARAAGGGVRVARVSGPMQLDSSGGSIFLPRVDSPVRASTGTGTITAWFTPTLMKTPGDSQLESKQGDIIVYVPRQLSVTIEATIDANLDHHIIADPSLPLKVSYVTGESGREMHGECAINGGGEVVRLRTAGGNIQLRYADDARLRQQLMVQQQIQQQMDAQEKLTLLIVQQSMEEVERQMQAPMALQPGGFDPGLYSSAPATPTPAMAPPRAAPRGNAPTAPPPPEAEVLWMKLGEIWWGGVRMEAAEQQKRLIHDVRPVYPDVARNAGIEGTVSMRVLIGKEGNVDQISVISGEQALNDAAVSAVRQWRYQPLLLDGKPVPVVTTVNLEFRLH
ncbi:MAG TPA: TonB family protein [Candidatus Acidoferrum sp.]|nr:TonB family protein [Candidatus Acidoferrum sp.]